MPLPDQSIKHLPFIADGIDCEQSLIFFSCHSRSRAGDYMFGQGLWAPYPGYWWWSPHTIRSGKLTSQPEKTLTFGVTVPQISSPRLAPGPIIPRGLCISRIRKRNALTEKAWEPAVRGLSKSRSLYQPEKTADITRSRPPLVFVYVIA